MFRLGPRVKCRVLSFKSPNPTWKMNYNKTEKAIEFFRYFGGWRRPSTENFMKKRNLTNPFFYFRYTPLVIYRARTKRFFYLLKLSLFRLFVFFDCRSEGDMILVTIAMLTGPWKQQVENIYQWMNKTNLFWVISPPSSKSSSSAGAVPLSSFTFPEKDL